MRGRWQEREVWEKRGFNANVTPLREVGCPGIWRNSGGGMGRNGDTHVYCLNCLCLSLTVDQKSLHAHTRWPHWPKHSCVAHTISKKHHPWVASVCTFWMMGTEVYSIWSYSIHCPPFNAFCSGISSFKNGGERRTREWEWMHSQVMKASPAGDRDLGQWVSVP